MLCEFVTCLKDVSNFGPKQIVFSLAVTKNIFTYLLLTITQLSFPLWKELLPRNLAADDFCTYDWHSNVCTLFWFNLLLQFVIFCVWTIHELVKIISLQAPPKLLCFQCSVFFLVLLYCSLLKYSLQSLMPRIDLKKIVKQLCSLKNGNIMIFESINFPCYTTVTSLPFIIDFDSCRILILLYFLSRSHR